jgi:hypothetical protein
MIEFKEINGQLCRTVEQPCHHCGQPEIIAEPVKEGSAEWALYQIRAGKKVVKEGGGEQYGCSFYKNRLFYLNGSGCLVTKNGIGLIDTCSEKEFLDLDKTGWQLYEPEPKSQYRVGDWVEIMHENNMEVEHGVIEKVNNFCPKSPSYCIEGVWYDCFGLEILRPNITYNPSRIIRKLSPSEVVIQIGCLRGVVRPLSTNSIHLWFHLVNNKDEVSATIRLTELDPQTRQLVEKLLVQQEEK